MRVSRNAFSPPRGRRRNRSYQFLRAPLRAHSTVAGNGSHEAKKPPHGGSMGKQPYLSSMHSELHCSFQAVFPAIVGRAGGTRAVIRGQCRSLAFRAARFDIGREEAVKVSRTRTSRCRMASLVTPQMLPISSSESHNRLSGHTSTGQRRRRPYLASPAPCGTALRRIGSCSRPQRRT